eukprot:Gb_18806 [translate_table: standard]
MNVMRGRDEGADIISEDEDAAAKNQKTSRHSSKKTSTMVKGRPVRPGMFLETVTKLNHYIKHFSITILMEWQVLSGMYETNVAGVTVQHLEWVHRETLNILQEIAF